MKRPLYPVCLLLWVLALGACSGEGGPAAEPGDSARSEPVETQPDSRQAAETDTGDAGSSTSETELPAPAATEAELGWSGRVSRWSRDVSRAVGRAEDLIERARTSSATAGTVRRDLRAASAVMRGCLASFEETVGKAPTGELQAAADDLRTMCAALQRAADLAQRATISAEARRRLQDELARSFRSAEAAGRRLQDYGPGEDAEIPTLQGKADHVSRNEPTFSEAARLLVGKPVEIRCWAPSDWRGLTRQVEAYTGRPLPARETGGFVLALGRANLSPRVCAQLVDLTYGPCEALPVREPIVPEACAAGSTSRSPSSPLRTRLSTPSAS